jgi:hypothetical protein
MLVGQALDVLKGENDSEEESDSDLDEGDDFEGD